MQRRLRPILPALVLLLLTACASAPQRPQPGSTMAMAANNVLFRAISLVGTPYHWGGNTPAGGFDCSGLVDYVFRTEARLDLPRTSRAMSRLPDPRLDRAQLAPGDLVFFQTDGNGVSHVGIYVGRDRFVHAPDTGGTVRLDALDNPYWSRHFLYGKRVLR
ncbi:MAG: C40 family peptidase [Metallibacterium scheffleri]